MTTVDNATLEELENDVWPAPEFGSYLVTTCHQLRQKPLGKFTVEDLRIMIGQGIGLKFLLPKAVEILVENPFAEGDFYEGDLLVQVIKVDRAKLEANEKIYQSLLHAGRAALQSAEPVLSNANRKLIDGFLNDL